ncbi:MAG: leucyl/phenylalanyl-tRNA--protein transferase [Maricaulaceae bacterium]|nr:leucyl/phenylalanyl-tRNA--protein transferase [Maricaulaceae bacterium]
MRGFGAEELLGCYARGVFPMAEGREDPRIFLLDPDERGVIPLDGFHIPRSLRRMVKRDPFQITVNRAFDMVLDACAAAAPGREETWINSRIRDLYADLHRRGYAHSLEAWTPDGRLAGGLYGVTLGAAYFGESMFSRETGASKVALVHLVARLRTGGFALLDAQFTTEHLQRFGAVTVSRADYRARLSEAIAADADFFALPEDLPGAQLLQSITQTS